MRVLFLIPVFIILTAATNINRTVEISNKWKSCRRDSDCIQVRKVCNDCGGADVINQKYSEKFDARWNEACGNYRGPYCNSMLTPDPEMSCKKRICQFGQ